MSESSGSSTDQTKRKLVLSILRFLHQEKEIHSNDDRESTEVAIQCLEAAYNVDYRRDHHEIDGVESLLTTFTTATRDPEQPSGSSHSVEAEEFKFKGNEMMRTAMYESAIEQYTRAIELNPKNAIYYCNRAAGFSRLNNHSRAIADCEEAVKLDPNYSKAYGRLGIAYSNLLMFQKAKEAYEKALAIDPSNLLYQENLKLTLYHLQNPEIEMNNLPGHNIQEIMQNPHLLNMASQLLNDPEVRNVLVSRGHELAEQMQVNDPLFVNNLRRQFEHASTNPDGNGDGASAKGTDPSGGNASK